MCARRRCRINTMYTINDFHRSKIKYRVRAMLSFCHSPYFTFILYYVDICTAIHVHTHTHIYICFFEESTYNNILLTFFFFLFVIRHQYFWFSEEFLMWRQNQYDIHYKRNRFVKTIRQR